MGKCYQMCSRMFELQREKICQYLMRSLFDVFQKFVLLLLSDTQQQLSYFYLVSNFGIYCTCVTFYLFSYHSTQLTCFHYHFYTYCQFMTLFAFTFVFDTWSCILRHQCKEMVSGWQFEKQNFYLLNNLSLFLCYTNLDLLRKGFTSNMLWI